MSTAYSETGPFSALVARQGDDNRYSCSVEERQLNQLPPGDLLVRVQYSSLNYKDALSASGNHGVTRRYPHVPGIDAAGTVITTTSSMFSPGDQVIVCGFDLGMNTDGGFSQFIRVPAEWAIPLPAGLTLARSMQIGTGGFTAGQCVDALLQHGLNPQDGSILVTGATGGVGSTAIMLLAELGFSVTAVTGKKEEDMFLQRLGATTIIRRDVFLQGGSRMLLRERWAGVIDAVGGPLLATGVKSTRYGGCVACCGNAAGAELPLNVYPFILRGVCLQGIDSASCPLERRKAIWERFARDWTLSELQQSTTRITLWELPEVIRQMLSSRSKGRYLVDLEGKKP